MNDKILKHELVDWKTLKLFQPADLKKMTEGQLSRLKESLKKNGFKSPFYVWDDGKQIWCIDGHTRIPVLKLLELEGEAIPKMLPATFIDCKNKKEAKKAILIYNSHYADINKKSMMEFISDLDIIELMAEIEIKDMDLTPSVDTIRKDRESKGEEDDVPADEMAMDIYDWINSFPNVLSMFSGGKDSMAMFADLLDHGIPKEKITLVFNLTPLDYPDLKEFVVDFAKKNNVKLEVIGVEKTPEEKREMFERNGFPLPYMSWCTGTWKVQPLNTFIKERCQNKDEYILCQGWRAEESEMRASSKVKTFHRVHNIRVARPILQMTEQEVFDIIKKHKWDLHRAYKYYRRLGCMYCFSKSREEWDLMRKHDPETFLVTLDYIADGLASHNISMSAGFDAIRKMMGKETIAECQKKRKEVTGQ